MTIQIISSYLIGALWGVLNLLAIKLMIHNLLIRKSRFLSSVLLLIKFPLLYYLGYMVLLNDQLDPWSVVLGFTIVLLAITVRPIWQSLDKFT